MMKPPQALLAAGSALPEARNSSATGAPERMGAALTGNDHQEDTMGKTGRKRRGRKKKAANHGKRPNA